MVREPLLVALLNRRPFFTKSGVLDRRQEPLQPFQIFEPDTFVRFEGLGDEGTEFRVTLNVGSEVTMSNERRPTGRSERGKTAHLVQPSTRSNYSNGMSSVHGKENVEVSYHIHLLPLVTLLNLQSDMVNDNTQEE